MQEIKIYCVALTFLFLWFDKIIEMFITKDKLGRIVHYNRYSQFIYENKPFNCQTCLSFWLGIILTFCTFELLFLTLPLGLKLLTKIYER